jgi:hypothetical protein
VSTWEWLPQVRLAISQALVGAGTTGVFYLALEPHVRRRWPTVLVAWSRVLSGRWRDPLVGRDVLASLAMGAAAALVALFFGWWGSFSMDADSSTITSVLSVRTTVAQLLSIPLNVFAFSFLLTVLMLVLRTARAAGVDVSDPVRTRRLARLLPDRCRAQLAPRGAGVEQRRRRAHPHRDRRDDARRRLPGNGQSETAARRGARVGLSR